MSLSTMQTSKLINTINNKFAEIGTKNGHAMPESTRNTDSIAYELLVAQHLYKMAEGRREEAQKRAIDAGVIFDHTVEPRDPGNYAIYKGDIIQFTCQVKNAAQVVNAKKLQSNLTKAGVDVMIINKCVKNATEYRAAPHSFVGAFITE